MSVLKTAIGLCYTCKINWSPRIWLATFALLFSCHITVPAQTEPPPEYALKAVFLFNFTQFVDWPSTAFADSQAPIVIGILGDDPFGAYLDETIKGEKVHNRPLIVRRYHKAEEIDTCHILFISGSEGKQVEQIATILKDRSVLTVGDTEGFIKKGGMIRFVTEKSKIRLKINIEATKAANLTISSKLLRLAEVVTPGKD